MSAEPGPTDGASSRAPARSSEPDGLPLERWRWPLDRLGDLTQALAREAGLEPHAEVSLGHPPTDLGDVHAWLNEAGGWLRVEVEQVSTPLRDLDTFFRRAGPALLRVEEPAGYVGLLGPAGRDRLHLLGPTGDRFTVPVAALRRRWSCALDARVGPAIEAMLDTIQVEASRRGRLREELTRERYGGVVFDQAWLLRAPPHAPLSVLLRQSGLLPPLALLLTTHLAQYALGLGAWWMLGEGSLRGRLDAGWMQAWALVLLTTVPFTMLGTWAQGRLAIGAGAFLKLRMMAGALRTPPEAVRHKGAGALLGTVVEAEAVESLALNGGFFLIIALIELSLLAAALVAAAEPALALLLGAWVLLGFGLGQRLYRRRQLWTRDRAHLTNTLVERMVGHRSRIAQEHPSRWHLAEDEALEGYLARSASLDRLEVTIRSLLPRGWVVAALLVLGLGATLSAGTSVAVAVASGAILMATGALHRFAGGLGALTDALVAWEQVQPLWTAGGLAPSPGAPALAAHTEAPPAELARGRKLIEMVGLHFQHGGRSRPVLQGATLELRDGDRVLLEGPSGGGKSTLASLLVGLRQPDSGLLLLRGLDRRTLGEALWRRRAVSAPQFHENRVIIGTFAFNLLLGRSWPAAEEEIAEAEVLCRELGLGPLLDRMPSGMLQMVGESGWQLSHGEKSRLYLARALLQQADLIVLDESFGALDPENMGLALRCALRRGRTLVVIAHP